ncbi:hypothetical protein GCM10027417_11750 [Glutamicibacter endophyticus]
MASIRGSYPHPVLDISDDVGSDFEVFNVTFAPSVDDVEISFQVRMTDPDIQRLLDSNHAQYSFRWKCSSTISSGTLQALPVQEYVDSTAYRGGIDQEDIRGTVRIEFKIIATSDISQYRLGRQHPDYCNTHFSLQTGDVLADAGFVEFEADKLYDPLSPPVGSCFRFVPNQQRTKGLSVRFDDNDQVVVVFPEKVMQGFALLKDTPELQISLVVLPALMQTINLIKNNLAAGDEGEDFSDRKWYATISDLVESVGSFEDSAFETAQKILGNQLDAALTVPLSNPDSEGS